MLLLKNEINVQRLNLYIVGDSNPGKLEIWPSIQILLLKNEINVQRLKLYVVDDSSPVKLEIW